MGGNMKNNNKKEAYFVVSDGNEPIRMFFTRESAMSGEYDYIDSFNEAGEKVISYKLEFDYNKYTTDF